MAGELITGPAQLQFRDLLLGENTDYPLTKLAGWEDMPPLDIGSEPKPRGHGAESGMVLAGVHTITATFDIDPAGPADTAAARRFLRSRAGVSVGGLQEPIAVSLDDGTTEIRYGQLTARSVPIELGYENVIRDAVLQWQCDDPRLYSVQEHTVNVRLPAPDPGAGSGAGVYPQAYPFDYAGIVSGGGPQPVVNAGNAPTPAVYTLHGPNVSPGIRITDDAGTRRILFGSVTLAPGETLVIDVLNRTVMLGTASRYGFSTGVPIERMELAPGTSTVSLEGAGDTSTLLTVAYRDADL